MWRRAAGRDYIPMKFLAGIEMVGGKETEEERALSLDEIKGFFTAGADKMLQATHIGSFPPCALKQEGRVAASYFPAQN